MQAATDPFPSHHPNDRGFSYCRYAEIPGPHDMTGDDGERTIVPTSLLLIQCRNLLSQLIQFLNKLGGLQYLNVIPERE